jgi:protein-disulfide isomerase/uncharacterized membrane protein
MVERLKKIFLLLLLALAGLGISIVAQTVHLRIAADPSYTSFCNVNSRLNCDLVMSSRYARLGGVPVSLYAIGYYLVLIAVGIALALVERARRREKLATLTVLLASWGLIFSIYMAVIAFGVLHGVCLLCASLYLVNIALFATTWRLRSRMQFASRQSLASRAGQDRVVLVGGLVAAVAVLAIGSWEIFGRGVHSSDLAAIKQQNPQFYQWYMAQPVVSLPRDGGHARGDTHAAVMIVEFSDFECGHCANFHRSLDAVLRRSGQDIQVAFHHFPLDSECNPKVSVPFHREACGAAVGAECAGDQGKFWRYHDLLFDNQQHLGRQSLIAYAAQLGLDVPRFTACLDDPEALARVKADIQAATALGVDSTPTIFINGRMLKSSLEPDALSDAVTLARATPAPH